MGFVGGLLLVLGCGSAGPLPNDVYVWQRAWTPAVRAAVTESGPSFDRLAVLVAEVTVLSGVVVVDVPPDVLTGPVVAVLRIGAFPGPFADDAVRDGLAAAGVSGVERLRAAGADVVELQVDFDAASAKLDGYRVWLDGIREASPVPVTITALPDWLGRPELPALLAATDGWTLQLHELVPPVIGEPSVPLFRRERAEDAISRAASLGRPFRIALPTCGYTVGFAPDGRFLGASAERPIQWRPEVRTERWMPDPTEVAALVAGVRHRRPPELVGVVWFRLPTTDDALAWDISTLRAVREGRTPVAHWAPRVVVDGALVDVRLANDGDGAGRVVEVVVDGPGVPLAVDAYSGWRAVSDGAEVRFAPSGDDPVEPGDDRAVGWVRFAAPGEVAVDAR